MPSRSLRRALSNLITNAMRHAERQVRVSFAINGQTARLDVDDDGPGVPEADWEKVFTPFLRLDDSRTRASGGHGLGLSIVRRIIYWHGGRSWSGTASSVARVSVWSGRGSTWIELTFPQLRQGGLQSAGSCGEGGLVG